MTIAEAIKQLDGADAMLFNRNMVAFNKAIIMAIRALQEKADREDPKPLTIEELRLMNGEPVWVAELSELIGQTGWAMVEVDDRSTYKGTPYVKCSICTLDVTFGGLHCYRHKPKEE